jgi:hypothetical protein
MEILQTSTAPLRHRAIAMEFAAFLDEHCVEMRILTDAGEAITIACPSGSILEIQRQIDRLGSQCPEIATWNLLQAAA